MAEQRTAKLVVFGGRGDTVHYSRHCTCSGYGSPERPHAAEPDEHTIIPDGTPALDIRAAINTDAGYQHVFRGPMVDVDLAADDVDACPEPSAMLAAGVAGNEFGGLLALHAVARARSTTPGPLDMVSTTAYVAGWVALGARAGHYCDNTIIWAA